MHPDPTTWHEAGHAAIAFLLGGQILEVTIESEEEDHEGHTRILWPSASADEQAHREAMTALAGPVAETHYRGQDLVADPAELARAWVADWQQAGPALMRLAPNPDERRRLCQRLIVDLHAEFEDREMWERVARLADALHAHGTLDEGLVAEVFGAT